jgi:hypothetical protein
MMKNPSIMDINHERKYIMIGNGILSGQNWATRSGKDKDESTKLTFQAFDAARTAARCFIGEELHNDLQGPRLLASDPSFGKDLQKTIDKVLLGEGVVTCADAKARVTEKIRLYEELVKAAHAPHRANNPGIEANRKYLETTVAALHTFGYALSEAIDRETPTKGSHL